jgi:hypothetical protein
MAFFPRINQARFINLLLSGDDSVYVLMVSHHHVQVDADRSPRSGSTKLGMA